MGRWYLELEIKSKKVNEIKELLFSTYDFEDMHKDEEEKNEIFNIEKNTLTFEGDEGFNFTNKDTYTIPDIKDLFITICSKFSKEKIEATAILANSIDSSYIEYKVSYKDNKLLIKENNKIVDEIDLKKYKKESKEEKLTKWDSNKSVINFFINEVEVYKLPCLPSVFIVKTPNLNYYLDIYFDTYSDMSDLTITLRDTKNGKEIIKIEGEYNEQEFTKEIAKKVFKKLEDELKKLQIDIIDIHIATDDEEYEYFSLMEEIICNNEF